MGKRFECLSLITRGYCKSTMKYTGEPFICVECNGTGVVDERTHHIQMRYMAAYNQYKARHGSKQVRTPREVRPGMEINPEKKNKR